MSRHPLRGVIVHVVRAASASFAIGALLAVCALFGSAPASAADCPTQTYLEFDHLNYVAVNVPVTVRLPAGRAFGTGTIDEPTSANGCKRERVSARLLAAGAIDPRVAVLAAGRPRTAFVIGYRCSGFSATAYWECLTQPLSFGGRRFTATSYPAQPAPQGRVPLGATLGTATYHGRPVTVRRITGVDPALAVGISGDPSTAFLSPTTCPYSGFSNAPEYDDLLRCLRAPVWFTFDPPGSEIGATVVARSDRPVSGRVAGASIALVRLPVVADYVPAGHGPLAPVARVAAQVNLRVPDVPQGLYEAVVSCPACASRRDGGATLFPAGSILVTPKPKTSAAIQIVSYVIAAAFLLALFLTFRTRHARRGVVQALASLLMGTRRRDPPQR